MRGKKKYKGRLPGAKDRKLRIRRTPAEIAAGVTMEEARKARAIAKEKKLELTEGKKRFRRTKEEIVAGLTIQQAIEARKKRPELDEDDTTKWHLLHDHKKGPKKKLKPRPQKEESCGVKIVAIIVEVDGTSRTKVQKDTAPDLAPCERLIATITYEKKGLSLTHSIFDEVRVFAEALRKYAEFKSLPPP